MSAVIKAAKMTRYVFGGAVFLFVVFAISVYMQAEGISKAYIEAVATKTLGVPVTIGTMNISVEKKIVHITDVKVGNPAGYKGPYSFTADSVDVNVDSFEPERVTFNLAAVKGLKVFLEMNAASTNIHDLRKQAEQNAKNHKKDGPHDDVRVLIRTVSYEKPTLFPVVTIQPTNIGLLTGSDVFVRDIGVAENGISIPHAMAKVVSETVAPFNLLANQAELFKGMTLETLNSMGVSTYDVFKKNVNKKINKDMNEAQKLLNSFFEEAPEASPEDTAGSAGEQDGQE